MSYLLDTDTCIHAGKMHGEVLSRLVAQAPSRLFVSVMTVCELRAGAEKSRHPSKALLALTDFLTPLTILEFGAEDAVAYAQIRSHLERRGETIGPIDLLIAAHARSRELTLVTHNTREFSRVPGLRLTDWTKR